MSDYGLDSIAFTNEISQTTFVEVIKVDQEIVEAIPDYQYPDYTSPDCDISTQALVSYAYQVQSPQVIPTAPVYNTCEITKPSITIHWEEIPSKDIAIYGLCIQYVIRNPDNITKTVVQPLMINGFRIYNKPNIQFSTTWYNTSRDDRTGFSEVLSRYIKKDEIIYINENDTKSVVGYDYIHVDVLGGLNDHDHLTLYFEELSAPNKGIIESITVCALVNSLGDLSSPETAGFDDTNLKVDLRYFRNGSYKFFSKNFPIVNFPEVSDTIGVWKKLAIYNLDTISNNGLDQITFNESNIYVSKIDATISKLYGAVRAYYNPPCTPIVNITRLQRGYGTNEVQYFSLPPATGGSFAITFKGETTVDIGLGSSADDVKNALSALVTIGVRNVEVTGTGSVSDPYIITFVNDLGWQDLPLISVDADKLSGVVPIIITELMPGTFNERQRITVPDASFKVVYRGNETSELYRPSNTQLRKALEGLLGVGNIIVTSPNGYGNTSTINHDGPWDVDFVGALKYQNVDQLEVFTISRSSTFTTVFSPISANVQFGDIKSVTLYPSGDLIAEGGTYTGFCNEQNKLIGCQQYRIPGWSSLNSNASKFIFTRAIEQLDSNGFANWGGDFITASFRLTGLSSNSIGRLITAKLNYRINNCSTALPPGYTDSVYAAYGIKRIYDCFLDTYLGYFDPTTAINNCELAPKSRIGYSRFMPWQGVSSTAVDVSGSYGIQIDDNMFEIAKCSNYSDLYLTIKTDFVNIPPITFNNGIINQSSIDNYDISYSKARFNQLSVTLQYEELVNDNYDGGVESTTGKDSTAFTIYKNNLTSQTQCYFIVKNTFNSTLGSPIRSDQLFIGSRKFMLFMPGQTPTDNDIANYKETVRELFDFIATQTGEYNDTAFNKIRFITLSSDRIVNDVHPPALLWFNESSCGGTGFSSTLNGQYFNNKVNTNDLIIAGTQDPNGSVITLWQGGIGINEKQRIDVSAAKGGSFTLAYDECVTSNIAFGSSAATVQAALSALTCLGNNVNVVLYRANIYDVEFINDLGRTNVTMLVGDGRNLLGGTVTPKVRVNGTTGYQEIQLLRVSNARSGGYRLKYGSEYSGYIPYNASASELAFILNGMAQFENNHIVVTGNSGGIGTPGGPYTIIFESGRGNISLPTIDRGSLSCFDVPLGYVDAGPYEYDLSITPDVFNEDTTFYRSLTPEANIAKYLTYERDLIDPNVIVNGSYGIVRDALIIKNYDYTKYNTYSYDQVTLTELPLSTQLVTGLSIIAINKSIDSARVRELIISHLQTKRGILPTRMLWSRL